MPPTKVEFDLPADLTSIPGFPAHLLWRQERGRVVEVGAQYVWEGATETEWFEVKGNQKAQTVIDAEVVPLLRRLFAPPPEPPAE